MTRPPPPLPTNVNSPEQLDGLPAEYLSNDPCRPLRHADEHGDVHRYALRPIFEGGVALVLLVELLERFSYYGLVYTQTPFLTGVYDKSWNAGMDSVGASSFVSASTAVAYTAPFLGAFLADRVLGDYRVVLGGSAFLYVPGCLLVALSAVPHLLGETFDVDALTVGMLILYPVGAGVIKSVVNVFGARQHHPVLQSSLIETYYVEFYMCINAGALMGGVLIPIVARRRSVAAAYFIPVVLLGFGVLLFAAGTPLYVRPKPHWRDDDDARSASPLDEEELDNLPKKGGDDASGDGGARGIVAVAGVSALIVPFMIVQQQMATTFKVQGAVMRPALHGLLDAASVNAVDALSVVLSGYVVYPALARRSVRLLTTQKFAVGSFFGVLAMSSTLAVEYRIHATAASGGEVSILWQALGYALLGVGEIFSIAAAYEIAFAIAPRRRKAFASATNLFFVGAVPNFVCIALYRRCEGWFRNHSGNTHIGTIEAYAQARVYNYFWVMLGIAVVGTVLNLLNPVKNWVLSVERRAAKLNSPADGPVATVPVSPPRETTKLVEKRMGDDGGEENSLLELNYLKSKQYSSSP